MGGATVLLKQSHDIIRISIHAPRVGGDHGPQGVPGAKGEFQSTPPVWGATSQFPYCPPTKFISIHAPRVGSDINVSLPGLLPRHFNPRSPCGERRYLITETAKRYIFQSTLPVWGATCRTLKSCVDKRKFQSTLPVWGATAENPWSSRKIVISIHAPRVGSDAAGSWPGRLSPDFNPRSPCGERQTNVDRVLAVTSISIHAPRVGSDSHGKHDYDRAGNFNPRSPCGERRLILKSCVDKRKFQSTLPVWGATISEN